jgi:purine-binding chemotaxis protein CheW
MREPHQGIDWANVKDRLRRIGLALEQALAHDPERVAAAYRERALELAGRRVRAATGPAALRVLTFAVGADRYGLDFADVAELLPFAHATPVPGAPAALLGVMNVHGEIQSVVDLGRLMELPGREDVTGGFVLLLRPRGTGSAALRVDRLDKIQMVPVETLAVPDGAPAGYLRGLAADRLGLLNTAAILAHPLFQSRTAS